MRQRRLGVGRAGKALALDRPVDDPLRAGRATGNRTAARRRRRTAARSARASSAARCSGRYFGPWRAGRASPLGRGPAFDRAERPLRNRYISSPARLSNCAARHGRNRRRSAQVAHGTAASRRSAALGQRGGAHEMARRRPPASAGRPRRAAGEGLRPFRRDRTGGRADRVEIERPVGVGIGHGRHQRARIGMQRVAEQLARAARARRSGRRTSRRCGRRCS